MNSPEHRLTPEQQRHMAQRIISDANLLKQGAQYNDAAQFALTDQQIEAIELAREAGEPAHDVYLQNQWLDTDIVVVWKSLGFKGRRTTNNLKRNCVHTRRNLLVLGKLRVSDFRDLGPSSMDEVAASVASNEFDIPWLAETTPEFVAGFCQSLGQVTLGAIGLEGKHRGAGKGDPVQYIGEILSMSHKEREEWVVPIEVRTDPLITATPAERITNLPEIYAGRFTAARTA